MLASSDTYLERIRPNDGRQESGWVVLTILLILLAGGYGISTNQTVQVKLPGYLLLDVADKAVLTALRNAGDEILFLSEAGDELPDVARLIADSIPPFSGPVSGDIKHHWQRIEGRCYFGTPVKNSPGVQFLLTLDQDVEVYWRPAKPDHNHQPERTGSACTPDEHWQVLNNA